jgi:hypothetical protein
MWRLKVLLETPTFLTDILAKIVLVLRKLLTQEQKKVIVDVVINLSLLSILCRKNFKWYNDLFQKQPDIVMVGF